MTTLSSAVHRSVFRIKNTAGDFAGGFASMLVALPSAIAFGIIIFAPLGNEYAAKGALAGIIGSVIIGILAPLFGGTVRLVSAPCAPAAALLSIFAADMVASKNTPLEMIPLYIALVGFGSGIIQLLAGLARGGTFIKYIPYPVVTGYLSGVGFLIFLGQLPRFLGLPKESSLSKGILTPHLWQWESIVIGVATIAVMMITPRLLKSLPASIAALGAGIITYFIIAIFNNDMLTLTGNNLIVGKINAVISDIPSMVSNSVKSVLALDPSVLSKLIVPVISLGVLLSIDTLKTCVVLDVLTGTRHNSNRELFGQGIANITSAIFGGVPGAGTMGGTLVNIYSGGKTRLSSILEGIFSLAVLLLFAKFIAWIPVASLAGVLLVVAVRMIDRKSLNLLKHKSTIFDFAVISAVVISAVTMSLITAAGVGILFAVILFLRDQIRFPVVRRQILGNRVFSKKNRPSSEHTVLETHGEKTILVELQGQLFFGTTDQLYTEIEPHISRCRYIILDMRRVLSVDYTAAKMLSQLMHKVSENNGILIFGSVPLSLPTGQNIIKYLAKLGFVEAGNSVMFFPDTDSALEWCEEQLIREALPDQIRRKALELHEIDFFRDIPEKEITTIAGYMTEKTILPGDKIFSMGESGGQIYFIRKGTVHIELPLDNGTVHHLATFGRGAFFGDMSFLDNQPRSADARAVSDVELFILDRTGFNPVIDTYPQTAGIFFERLSLEISRRLRLNVIELKALQEG